MAFNKKPHVPITYEELIAKDWVYHGALRDATDQWGGYSVIFREGFRTKKGDQAIGVCPVDNPGLEQAIIAENDNIGGKLSRLEKGKTYILKAYGNRAAANVRVFLLDGSEVDLTPIAGSNGGGYRRPTVTPPAVPAPQALAAAVAATTPPLSAPVVGQEVRQDLGQTAPEPALDMIELKLLNSLRSARAVVEAYRAAVGSEPNETIRTLATTLFIERNRKGL
jgi:hypothetical protein